MARNINDGQARTTVLRSRDRLYQEVHIAYRLMLEDKVLETNAKIVRFVERSQYTDARNLKARAISEYLTEWDEVDKEGKPLPIKAASIATLPSPLLRRLLDVVMGYDAGDLPDDASREEQEEHVSLQEEAMETGASFGQAANERDAKNSPAG